MRPVIAVCSLAALLVGLARGEPIVPEALPLALPDLGSHLTTIGSRLQEQRLPLPSVQDLEAIKKVAQILIMLGEQVIPAIIGELPSPPCEHGANGEDSPSGAFNDKLTQ